MCTGRSEVCWENWKVQLYTVLTLNIALTLLFHGHCFPFRIDVATKMVCISIKSQESLIEITFKLYWIINLYILGRITNLFIFFSCHNRVRSVRTYLLRPSKTMPKRGRHPILNFEEFDDPPVEWGFQHRNSAGPVPWRKNGFPENDTSAKGNFSLIEIEQI